MICMWCINAAHHVCTCVCLFWLFMVHWLYFEPRERDRERETDSLNLRFDRNSMNIAFILIYDSASQIAFCSYLCHTLHIHKYVFVIFSCACMSMVAFTANALWLFKHVASQNLGHSFAVILIFFLFTSLPLTFKKRHSCIWTFYHVDILSKITDYIQIRCFWIVGYIIVVAIVVASK